MHPVSVDRWGNVLIRSRGGIVEERRSELGRELLQVLVGDGWLAVHLEPRDVRQTEVETTHPQKTKRLNGTPKKRRDSDK